MHGPAQAASELRRCMTQKRGFVGCMLNDFQSAGRRQHDAVLRLTGVRRLLGGGGGVGCVGVYPSAQRDAIDSGREQLAYSALGYANRVNMHALGIITSGVLDRFPGVRLVLWHIGEHLCVRFAILSVLLLLLHHPLPAIMNLYAQQILGANG